MQEIIKNRYGEKLDYILEGNKNSSEIIIFVHGLLTNLDEYTNLFKDISNGLKKRFLILRFSQSGCGKSEGKEEEYNIKKSAEDLESILKFCNKNFPYKKNNLISHSIGSYIVFLTKYYNISKTILVSPLPINILEVIKKIELRIIKNKGILDKKGTTTYFRSDGNINKIGKTFWESFGLLDIKNVIKNFNKIFIVAGKKRYYFIK